MIGDEVRKLSLFFSSEVIFEVAGAVVGGTEEEPTVFFGDIEDELDDGLRRDSFRFFASFSVLIVTSDDNFRFFCAALLSVSFIFL